ncbi:MAG: hypothetical protein C0432_02140 [Candidatus Puniceispirillum sp.]|nr:hypothetical protein [Candidatus Pelagibacter sp.]MBA4283075.1 hypothetical protein [Candidatus Puniceispirillum sp.]
MDHAAILQLEEFSKYLDCARSDLQDLGCFRNNLFIFSETQEQLDVIVQSMVDATNRILDNAEEINQFFQKSKLNNSFSKVQEAITKIYENCIFQDLTGQRIKKVSQILNDVELLLNQIFAEYSSHEGHPLSVDMGSEKINQICKVINILKKLKSELLQEDNPQVESKLLNFSFKELEEVIQFAEQSTHRILNSAESLEKMCGEIEAVDQKELKTKIANIFEACSFQDLVGQRIRVVLRTFDHINKIILKIYMYVKKDDKSNDFPSPKMSIDGNKLYGPQLPQNALKQDIVDNLMSDDFFQTQK